VYELDALVSVLKARRDHSMSWVEFLEDSKDEPELRLEGLAHPCLPPADVRRNDVSLGGPKHKKHMILTGPNAGGKSTLMKAMLCAALMAQTLTIATCSTAAAMTPFDMLGSHLNVADRTGHESMFEAEMHRMAGVLSDRDRESTRIKKRLLAIDELFSSTNVVEGTSAAAACARRLGKRPGTLSVISTHFSLVAKQVNGEEEDGGDFACCSMPVKRTSSMEIEFPYKLTEGSRTQYIALELMAKSGCGAFDAELVADALRIKRSLVQRLNPKAAKKSDAVYER
jgi:DNA mismatch repair ATPase MutS